MDGKDLGEEVKVDLLVMRDMGELNITPRICVPQYATSNFEELKQKYRDKRELDLDAVKKQFTRHFYCRESLHAIRYIVNKHSDDAQSLCLDEVAYSQYMEIVSEQLEALNRAEDLVEEATMETLEVSYEAMAVMLFLIAWLRHAESISDGLNRQARGKLLEKKEARESGQSVGGEGVGDDDNNEEVGDSGALQLSRTYGERAQGEGFLTKSGRFNYSVMHGYGPST